MAWVKTRHRDGPNSSTCSSSPNTYLICSLTEDVCTKCCNRVGNAQRKPGVSLEVMSCLQQKYHNGDVQSLCRILASPGSVRPQDQSGRPLAFSGLDRPITKSRYSVDRVMCACRSTASGGDDLPVI